MTHFTITHHIPLVNVQTNYCNNNLLILDVKLLNKVMKPNYFYTFKALWDCQSKIKMCYGISRVKKQLSGKRSIIKYLKACLKMFHMSKSNTRNTRKRCEMLCKFNNENTERRPLRLSGVFIFDFKHILHLFLMFLLFNLNK